MNSGRKKRMITHHAYWYLIVLAMILWLSGCQTGAPALSAAAHNSGTVQPTVEKSVAETAEAESKEAKYVLTPYPTRPLYSPGELVNYTAQTGDTLPALAARFNTSVKEILEANSFIPPTATTMPPGMPMKIPIYYLPLWGSPYKILPDSLFVDGPAQRNFDTQAFVSRYPGWLNGYTEYAAQAHRSGAEIVDFVALRYSVSPRLLLALLEYQSGALSNPELSESLRTYPMGYEDGYHKGLYLQLNWAANLLNNGYYRYRAGILLSIEHPDGTVERIDPWQNAATVSLQNYFNQLYSDHKAMLMPFHPWAWHTYIRACSVIPGKMSPLIFQAVCRNLILNCLLKPEAHGRLRVVHIRPMVEDIRSQRWTLLQGILLLEAVNLRMKLQRHLPMAWWFGLRLE